MTTEKIPYKIYLTEDELPKFWYNVRADMKTKPAPLLNPATGEPMTFEDLRPVFCDELIRQELDNDTRRSPSPRTSGTSTRCTAPRPGPGLLPGGEAPDPRQDLLQVRGQQHLRLPQAELRHRQAFYAKHQGLKGVTTETGAGQWGTALSMACSYLDLDCQVYMVKVSYEQKPFRREVMKVYGASSPPPPPRPPPWAGRF